MYAEVADTIDFSWAENHDFSEVDYFFMPVKHNDNYVVLVIDNVHKKYHFL
ncbi:hypothetical protein LINPERHAP1_LOCUS26651, partial [Linum perenne]